MNDGMAPTYVLQWRQTLAASEIAIAHLGHGRVDGPIGIDIGGGGTGSASPKIRITLDSVMPALAVCAACLITTA